MPKSNGQQVFRSTYRPLTQAEYDNPIIQQEMKEYDEAIAIKLGPCAKDSDFEFDFIPDAHTLRLTPTRMKTINRPMYPTGM